MNRSRKIIVILAAAVGLILFIKFAVSRPIKRIKVLNRIIPKKEEKLKRLIELQQEYLVLRSRLEKIEGKIIKTGKDFQIEEWLEKNANELGMDVERAKLEEKKYRISLKQANLERLTKYLYKLKNPDSPIVIKKAQVNNMSDDFLDVVLEMVVLRK